MLSPSKKTCIRIVRSIVEMALHVHIHASKGLKDRDRTHLSHAHLASGKPVRREVPRLRHHDHIRCQVSISLVTSLPYTKIFFLQVLRKCSLSSLDCMSELCRRIQQDSFRSEKFFPVHIFQYQLNQAIWLSARDYRAKGDFFGNRTDRDFKTGVEIYNQGSARCFHHKVGYKV